MLKVLYNIYIYDRTNRFTISDNYINIHQVQLAMAFDKQQVEQTIAQYVTDLYGDLENYQYKYEMID